MTTYYPAQIEQGVTGQGAVIVVEPTQDDIVMNGQGAAIVAATVAMDAGNAGDVWPTFSIYAANGAAAATWTENAVASATWVANGAAAATWAAATYDATTWTEN